MDNLNARTINELFIRKAATEEGREKIAMEGTAFLRTKLREVSFARKILPPQYVTVAELQRSVNHEQFVKLVEKEPDSTAMVVSFRGGPDINYIEGERYEVPFFPIASEQFEKLEEELLAYEVSITELIERNAVLDIQKIEDQAFIRKVNTAVTHAGNAITGSYNGSTGEILTTDFRRLFDLLDGNELRSETLLMNTKTFNRIVVTGSGSSTFGDGTVLDKITVEGYDFPTLFGRRLVVTNKVSLVPDGQVYAFAAPEFMGHFFVLKDATFDMEKKWNLIQFRASETIGMAIGNTKAVAKLTVS